MSGMSKAESRSGPPELVLEEIIADELLLVVDVLLGPMTLMIMS